MKETECLALPYPECAPPLVKDLSDIQQFQDLAEATDAAVQIYADRIVERLRSPDVCYMTTGLMNATGNDVIMNYSVSVYDNAGMTNTAIGGIVIQEDGEYLLGGCVQGDAAQVASMELHIQPLVNGDAVSGRYGPGKPANGLGGTLELVSWQETLFLRAGDIVVARTHHAISSATNVQYLSRLWALLVQAND